MLVGRPSRYIIGRTGVNSLPISNLEAAGLDQKLLSVMVALKDEMPSPHRRARADTDTLVAYLLSTQPSPVAPPRDDSALALATKALSTALVLASGQKGAHVSGQKDAHVSALLGTEVHASTASGRARSLGSSCNTDGLQERPCLPHAVPRMPPLMNVPRHRPLESGRRATPDDYTNFRQQLTERALSHCDQNFDAWADVAMPPPLRRRPGVPLNVADTLSPRAFMAQSLRRAPPQNSSTPRSPRTPRNPRSNRSPRSPRDACNLSAAINATVRRRSSHSPPRSGLTSLCDDAF